MFKTFNVDQGKSSDVNKKALVQGRQGFTDVFPMSRRIPNTYAVDTQ